MGMEIGVAGMVAAMVVALGVFVWMVSSFYTKCGPNQAMIISGMLASENPTNDGPGHRVVIGGGTTIFPVIQQCSFVSLECIPIKLEPKTPYITKDGTPIKFRAVAQVKVKADPASILSAAESFLNKTESQTAERVTEIILSHTRSIAGTLSYSEILHDLHGFSQKVQEESISSLTKFGMTVITYSIDEMDTDSAQLQSLVFDAAMKA
jgi:flotillin